MSRHNINTPAAILCFVLIVFLVFPLRSAMNCCFRQNSIPSGVEFEDARTEFLTDYERENPVTRAQAIGKQIETEIGLDAIPIEDE